MTWRQTGPGKDIELVELPRDLRVIEASTFTLDCVAEPFDGFVYCAGGDYEHDVGMRFSWMRYPAELVAD